MNSSEESGETSMLHNLIKYFSRKEYLGELNILVREKVGGNAI